MPDAKISILRPVRSATIFSLLQRSVSSGSDPVSHCRAIQNVSAVRLFHKGSLLEDQPSNVGSSFVNAAMACRIHIDERRDRHGLQESVLQLARFVPVAPKEPVAPGPYGCFRRLEIQVDAGPDLDVWMQHVSRMIPPSYHYF